MDQMQTSESALIQSKLDLHKRYFMCAFNIYCTCTLHFALCTLQQGFNVQDLPQRRKEQADCINSASYISCRPLTLNGITSSNSCFEGCYISIPTQQRKPGIGQDASSTVDGSA